MKSQIAIDATAEIVATLTPQLFAALQPTIAKLVYLSVYQVAGLVDVSPDYIRKIMGKKIVVVSPRKQRIRLSDALECLAEVKRKQAKLGRKPKGT